MKSILRVFKRDKLRVFLVVFTSAIGNIFTLYPITRVSYIVDSIANGSITYEDVIKETSILILVGFLRYLIGVVNDYFTFMGYYKCMKNMSEEIQKSVYKHTPVLFNKFSIGDVVSRSTNDINDYISPTASFGLFCFLEGVLYNIYITALIFSKSNILFTSLVILPYIAQTIYLYRRKTAQKFYYDKMLKVMDKITEETLENIKGIRVIRTYNLLSKVRKSFLGKLNSYATNNLEYTKQIRLFQTTSTIATAFAYVIAVVLGFYFVNNGVMTIGGLIAVFLVFNLIQWPYIALSQFIVSCVETKQGMDRIEEIEKSPVLVNNEEAVKDFEFNNSIEFKNFNFNYDNEVILNDINLKINKGETIGVVGKTGSGKSTLVKQFLRMFPVEKNTLFLDELSIEKYNDYSIRNKMAIALQEHQLFSKTLKENILFYRSEYEDRLDDVLLLADLKKDVEKFKYGIDTLIGENGISLSGGQKQRIGIARALISNPEILILDDSLSAVDSNTEKNIIENIKNNRIGKTNIIVSHRVSAVRHADKIIVLNNGKIEAEGTHDYLIRTCKWYRELDKYQNYEVNVNEK